ncbi:MAG: GH36-type glycosyl hydrolase domain-containing protein, partial [Methylocystis sp.]
TTDFVFAVVGSMTDATLARELADKYSNPVEDSRLLALMDSYWGNITRGARIKTSSKDPVVAGEAAALDTMLPWLAHDAIIHLTVPHGLEQYTGAAWGTRDVCQGPVELFLSFEHDEPVKQILKIIFAQQYETQGDWPQWFMLEPYSFIQDKQSHGDIIVWPLKALCDYIEATGDLNFLDEPVAWRREDNFEKTERREPISVHIDKLIATIRSRFIAGTTLIRYGNGDWNDALQPVDTTKRDWMVSSWTVALLYQQLCRYAVILQRKGATSQAEKFSRLAADMRADFNKYLMRDGTVAGYAVFKPEGGAPDLLIHPSDTHTGVFYSLIPMTQAILGELFTPEQAQHHLDLIRKHLLFVDGARLMDKPIAYHGGLEKIFRRAESSAFFGREIGLMYTHSHLRYGEAMSALNESQALREALLTVNPISVTERVKTASLRQRNTYFSSSDAAFRDRYHASDDWARVKNNAIAFDGGWRIYSSGPGVYTNILIQQALGVRRYFGERIVKPTLPSSLGFNLEWPERLGGAQHKPL